MMFQEFLKRLKPNSDGKPKRILILGLDNSGKTSILDKLSLEDASRRTMPTQGFNVKSVVKNDVTLNLWDIGGQRSIRQYWEQYFDDVGALVYVIDSTDESRIGEAANELIKMMKEEKLNNVPVLILANKQDLVTALSVDEIGESLHPVKISGRPWHIQACSAKTGQGVEEGFNFLIPYLNN